MLWAERPDIWSQKSVSVYNKESFEGVVLRVAVLFNLSRPEVGGGYTFNQMILASLEKNRDTTDLEIFTVFEKNQKGDFQPDIIAPGAFVSRLEYYKKFVILSLRFVLTRKRFSVLECKARALEKVLEHYEIDMVWSVQPLTFPIQIPFFTTSWDISHRITPYFPEVSGRGVELSRRNLVSESVFAHAYKILVGTARGREEIQFAYGVNPERILIRPLPTNSPSDLLELPRNPLLFFYPANFWIHKNHNMVLEALRMAIDKSNLDIKVIFSGSDKGNLPSIRAKIKFFGLEHNTEILGFVGIQEISRLLLTSNAMIFASLIGPDNLPPLEALAHGCRVIVADIPGAREQLGDCAEYFSPSSPSQLSEIILQSIKNFPPSSQSLASFRKLLSGLNPDDYVAKILEDISATPSAVFEIASSLRAGHKSF